MPGRWKPWEEKLIQEEVKRRTKELIEERVQEIMNSDSVQQSLHARLVDERKVLEEQVSHLDKSSLPHTVPGNSFLSNAFSSSDIWYGGVCCKML